MTPFVSDTKFEAFISRILVMDIPPVLVVDKQWESTSNVFLRQAIFVSAYTLDSRYRTERSPPAVTAR